MADCPMTVRKSRPSQGDGDRGGMASVSRGGDTSCAPDEDENLPLSLRPQNGETLLPRKRSQATKSPVPSEALSAAAKGDVNDEAVTAEATGEGAQTKGEREPPTPIRRDLRATPHDMKNASMSQILNHSKIGLVDDSGEQCEGGSLHQSSSPEENNLLGARASLNASFEAAAAASASASAAVQAPCIKDNPRYTSPKRRKQSFDFQDPQQDKAGQAQLQQQFREPAANNSFTPMRPPQTQQKRNRKKSDGLLFSPKPTYGGEDKGSGGQGKHRLYPPRPNSSGSAPGSAFGAVGSETGPGAATPSSPLTPSPKNTAARRAGKNSNNSSASDSFGGSSSNSQSPGTPFRFHAFPASLPRVNPRGVTAGSAIAPFRLNGPAMDDDKDDETKEKNGEARSAARLSLRPKPTASATSAAKELPPPSPASRRLFMRGRGDETAGPSNAPSLGASFDSAAENNNSKLAPSLSNDQNDVSGDWSEATSIRSTTNERMRMTNVPSHVNMTAHNKLNDLEEEDDTVIMEDDDHDDHDEEVDLLLAKGSGSNEGISGTRLNFGSPTPQHNSRESSSGEQQSEKKKAHESSMESTLHPHTPRGMLSADQFHMPNLEMSPIVRLPEDDDDHEMGDGDDHVCSIPMKGSLDSDEPREMGPPRNRGPIGFRHEGRRSSPAAIQPLFRTVASPIMPDKSSEPAVDISANSSSTMLSAGSNSAVDTTASTAGVNNTTMLSNASNITRPTARKVRPMPDTSAFDVGTPSQASLGSKDSGFHSHKTGIGSTASGGENHHRLLCPPTPIRTPAWAHNIVDRHQPPGGLKRANSLITTKVLAACPPQVLDNLSSLEDSMLENDISGTTMDSTVESGSLGNNHHHNHLFAPVDEGEEQRLDSSLDNAVTTIDGGAAATSCMFRSLEGNGPADMVTKTDDESRKEDGIDHQDDRSSLPFYNPSRNAAATPVQDNSNTMMSQPVSFSDFDNLGILGSGAFADVYKVRSKDDRRLYAIKRTRRQFRGVKDRERAMAEVNTMRRLQTALLKEAADSHEKSGGGGGAHNHQHQHSKNNYGLYLLFFIRAWQQDGFFYCQTELCSRATCRHLRLSLSSEWERDSGRYPSLQSCLLDKKVTTTDANSDKNTSMAEEEGVEVQMDRLLPERAVWQIAHDISRGLFHIHSYGMVHYDIKPSNVFFAYNSKWGTICKIGDFGLTGDIGTKDDGQEGDTVYMPAELLSSSSAKHPAADIFSLGLALYELAASPSWSLPREGDGWHRIRSGGHDPELPSVRSASLVSLIKAMIRPNVEERPSAEEITELEEVRRASALSDSFLSRYVADVDSCDSRREREMAQEQEEARRRSSTPIASSFLHHQQTPVNHDEEDRPAMFR